MPAFQQADSKAEEEPQRRHLPDSVDPLSAVDESQTQLEEGPELLPVPIDESPDCHSATRDDTEKRKISGTNNCGRIAKRMKISVGLGVDLGD